MDPYIYQYTIGGALFTVGLWFAAREGYVGLRGRGLRNLVLMLGGLAFFMVLQGWLQYADMAEAPDKTFTSDAKRAGTMGTPLDYAVMAAYFVIILAVGTWFGRGQKSTKDFFFGGQRFSWWLIAFSLIASLIGSYSFVKYSLVAYKYGVASTQSYLNDWFWMPFLVFGWIPILYFSRVTSIPEYFARRFGEGARKAVTALLLLYMVGYVGVNLFTMGKALNILLGWPVPLAATLVATISGIYVTAGGQTSVIMTDLLQGVMLLAVGLLLLWLGADHMGGFEALWRNLPRGHRTAFANFNTDSGYNSVGIFWQDAMANTAVFYFLNQGIAMRFMSARSVGEARKAAVIVPIVLMPIAAAVVASGGWVGKALSHAGILPSMQPEEAFYVAAQFLSRPGVFGLVMAALTAALMSTVDTLVTAIAAVTVNDIYRPYIRPAASERELLRVARFTSVGVMLLGLLLVPVFMGFESIFAAHGAFTAAITPPLVVALLLGVFWPRYTSQAAVWTLVGGLVAMVISIIWPELVAPFSWGVPPGHAGPGLLGGAHQFKYTRACYGLAVSAALGVSATLLSRRRPDPKALAGLVFGTVADAIRRYKGVPGTEVEGRAALAGVRRGTEDAVQGEGQLSVVRISQALAATIGAGAGDLVYVSDRRAWLGGLRSTHAIIGDVAPALSPAPAIELGPDAYERVVAPRRSRAQVTVQKLY